MLLNAKKLHKIAKELILPRVFDMVSTMIGEYDANQHKKIPSSTNTSCRITVFLKIKCNMRYFPEEIE